MKKLFLFGFGLFLGTTILRGQEALIQAAPNTISVDLLKNMPQVSHSHVLSENHAKTTTCEDTLRYVWYRRSQVGNSGLVGGIIVAAGEKSSQTFLNAGSLTITGVEVYALNYDMGTNPSPSTGTNIVVEVFNVNASNVPTTSLGTATSTSLITAGWSGGISGTDHINVVSFSTPITVTGNYAIAISTTTPSGKLGVMVDTLAANLSYHENLGRFYYLGTWNQVPDLFGGDNAEHISSPIVTYSNTATGTVSPTSAPAGTPITFTNTSNTTVFNRMNSYGMFKKHWLNAPQDSVFVWSPSGNFSSTSTDLIWAENTTHTYTTDGTYTPGLAVLGGMSKTCLDINTNFSVNIGEDTPPPNCGIAGVSTVCQGQSITLTASADGGSWSTSDPSKASVDENGVVTAVADATGMVTISYGGSSSCTGTATHDVTITTCGGEGGGGGGGGGDPEPEPLPDCSISGDATVCKDKTITLTPSASDATWSVTPEGVVTVNNSGVVAGVAVGTAVVSFTSPNCTNTGTHTVTVNSCASVGVEDIDAFSNIVIAPNPTTNNVIIAGLPQQSTLTITDLNGKILLVKQSNITQEELSLEQFVNGVYLVNIQSEHANGTHKIMLNK